jgi:hypothetical protein
MERKIYKPLLLSAKQGLFALALALFSGTVYSQTTYTFSYTGSTQTISLPAGTYSMTCWGADGGTISANTALPGKGGYSSGTLTLSATTTFTIYVGGKGNGGAQPLGGFNSGNGTTKTNTGTATGGGGASDVRVLTNDVFHRIIVAGGGGGQGNSTGTGGHGGGLTGQNGQGTSINIGIAGTQTSAGVYPGGSDSKPAAFGEGSDGPAGTTGGQGGGGWYGGSFGTRTNGGGAGGSGYVLTSTSYTPTGYFSAHVNYYFNNAVTLRPNESGFVANPVTTGNGLVLIKEFCSIDIYASGSNSVNPLICSGQSLTLTTNAISNYSWSTGATTPSLVVSPTTNTVYALTATSPSNCTTSRSITVTVSSGPPVLSVTQSTTSTCLGNTVSLDASGALTYTWSHGISSNVSFTPAATTVYTVTGQNGCGTTQATATVTVSPLPVAGVATPSVICENGSMQLTATGATTYTWEPTSQTGSNVASSASVTTVFTVTGESGNCIGTHTFTVIANPNPTLSIVTTATRVCLGNAVTFTVTGADTYTWVQSLTGSLVTSSPTTATLYQVSGTNSVNCISGTSQIVLVDNPPAMGANLTSTAVCAGSQVLLSASGANNYTWSTGATNTSTLMVSPPSFSVYTVTGGHTTNSCTATKEFTVNAVTAHLGVSTSTAICMGAQITLTAGPGLNISWNPGGPFPVLSNISPTATTVYSVSAQVTTMNVTCPASSTVQVTVHQPPVVTANASQTVICRNDPLTINAQGAQTYSWSTGQTNASITYTSGFSGPKNISVEGTDNNGCKSTGSMMVQVNPCTGLRESVNTDVQIYPNPSSGSFIVKCSKPVTVIVYNALGQPLRSAQIDASGSLEMHELAGGLYLVSIDDGRTTSVKTVVVNR